MTATEPSALLDAMPCARRSDEVLVAPITQTQVGLRS
jgi:hypothetical protein